MALLEKIESPDDIKALDAASLSPLCAEIREFLLNSVSKTGGHLASNLGVVELTVAIHRVFDTSKDRLVFDVGHQSYIHKMLTGRRGEFSTLRKLGGLSGFPKPHESVHDAFIAGHASNSISVALGMARARTLENSGNSVVVLLGDGALTGGLAYEGLSDAGESGEPLVIILNDNGMSITPNVGGMAHYLSKQRLKPSYVSFKKRYRKVMEHIPGGRAIYRFTHWMKNVVKEAVLHCSMFEEMGLEYAGPVDGHDIPRLVEALTWARDLCKPVVVHVITKKGKGYRYSEETPDKYHGVGAFNLEEGVKDEYKRSFSTVFGETMDELAAENPKVCAITAAMAGGTGLEEFSAKYPQRFFDVSIAEGHAASMASGMAAQGMIPVFAVYSTFLQRAYDMLLHDVALSGHHVVFGVDRAGLVGADGETHQGIFDVGFLATVPGMTIYAPASFMELHDMLRAAVLDTDGPAVVRYPRGGEGEYNDGGAEASKVIYTGSDVTIVTYGVNVNDAIKAAEQLGERGVSAEIIKLGRIAPVEMADIAASVAKTGLLVVNEECIGTGGVGERIVAQLAACGKLPRKCVLKNLGSSFVSQGTVEQLRRQCGIDADGITASVLEAMKNG